MPSFKEQGKFMTFRRKAPFLYAKHSASLHAQNRSHPVHGDENAQHPHDMRLSLKYLNIIPLFTYVKCDMECPHVSAQDCLTD